MPEIDLLDAALAQLGGLASADERFGGSGETVLVPLDVGRDTQSDICLCIQGLSHRARIVPSRTHAKLRLRIAEAGRK